MPVKKIGHGASVPATPATSQNKPFVLTVPQSGEQEGQLHHGGAENTAQWYLSQPPPPVSNYFSSCPNQKLPSMKPLLMHTQ